MKILSLIFSLFFAFLVTIPCDDAISDFSNSSVNSFENKTDSSHESGSDACSVFFTCSCCRIAMGLENIEVEIVKNLEITYPKKNLDFQSFTFLKVSAGIWQPPKLC